MRDNSDILAIRVFIVTTFCYAVTLTLYLSM